MISPEYGVPASRPECVAKLCRRVCTVTRLRDRLRRERPHGAGGVEGLRGQRAVVLAAGKEPVPWVQQLIIAGIISCCTHGARLRHETARCPPTPPAAWSTSFDRKFFHWFLEFPEILERGGFDCILGNPPYLGDKHLTGTYGHPFCHYLKWEYAPAGLNDLVVYFVRRIYSLLRPNGFTAFITTNSIKDGDIRKGSLEYVLESGGAINFAIRGIKWPGRANLVVSLASLYRGQWVGKRWLDGKQVGFINSYFEDTEDIGNPYVLSGCADRVFTGYHFWGDGFVWNISPPRD